MPCLRLKELYARRRAERRKREADRLELVRRLKLGDGVLAQAGRYWRTSIENLEIAARVGCGRTTIYKLLRQLRAELGLPGGPRTRHTVRRHAS